MSGFTTTAASCGFTGYIVFLVAIGWMVSSISRIPRDLSEIRKNYIDRNWGEFRVNLVVMGSIWFAVAFCGLFIYSAVTMPEGNYG